MDILFLSNLMGFLDKMAEVALCYNNNLPLKLCKGVCVDFFLIRPCLAISKEMCVEWGRSERLLCMVEPRKEMGEIRGLSW